MHPTSSSPWIITASGRLLRNLDDIASRVTATIRDDLAAYETIPLAEHIEAVSQQISLVLNGIRQGVLPGPADLRAAGALGRRRAEQGIPVSILLQAFELPMQELWREYADAAAGNGRAAGELVAVAPSLMSWLHQIGSAAADGHQLIATTRLADDVRLQNELFAMIMADSPARECDSHADRLGLNRDGRFVAVACLPLDESEDLQRLVVRTRLNAGPVIVAEHESAWVVLAQGRLSAVQRLMRPLADGGVLGVGSRRHGLRGARLSVADACSAAQLARRLGRDVEFDQDWWLASVLDQARHSDAIDSGSSVAALNPHLALTVQAFADNGFSVAAAARAQQLHANTVAYRLRRWSTLTGWDVNDFQGLARSVVAIALA